jgi:pimeloyl-ACP methyl ester carboxylesterase
LGERGRGLPADIQISVQYLVYAIRREFKASGRELAIFGISQGGLLARMALTYWPDLRTKVADVLSAAGSLHGTTVPPFPGGKFCSAKRPCIPAEWQQEAGSDLLQALDAKSTGAPGPTAWTTMRSSRSKACAEPSLGETLLGRVGAGRIVGRAESTTVHALIQAVGGRDYRRLGVRGHRETKAPTR